ncbi:MAG: undecaprenyl-diphosphate phosphatase [Proteobacteria bacterium]|nr:undecaprenyl-diphosphate phosphatase [Pseudomonadota bacterium]
MDIMHLVAAAFLGVIQGLTEFLPISSTAHLLITEHLIGFSDPDSVFTVMIQLGSILAVMWLYRQKIIDVITGLPTKPEARRFALMLIVAFLPAIPIGYFGKHYVTTVLHESFNVMAWAFIIGGILMLLIERFRPTPKVEDASQTPVWRAFVVGIFQCFALIPGVSRSGATIYGGLLTGLDRRAAAEFSFFLAMPTMAAAFVLDFIDVRDSLTTDRAAEIAVGFVFAFLSSLLVVKPFLAFVTRAGFMPFAGYRILAGAAVLAALATGYLQ